MKRYVWMCMGVASLSLTAWNSTKAWAEEEKPVPYSRTVEAPQAVYDKLKELFPEGTLGNVRSYWFGNAGAAGNGTSGGSRRYEITVTTKKEKKVPEGQPKPAKPEMITETHVLQMKKSGYVVSRTDPIDVELVPEVVKTAALREGKGDKIESATKVESGSVTRYKVKVEKGGEVYLDSEGTVVPGKYAAEKEEGNGGGE